MIKAVIFDFGGVLAEEGFREGLMAIGKRNGLDPDRFFTIARELIYETGFITGSSDEAHYWSALRKKTGIRGSDREYRREILDRFVLREKMIRIAKEVRSRGLITAILSDQTNWLDEINRRSPFFRYFDFVFNSYVLKKSKRDPSVFKGVCSIIGVMPREALFVDDNSNNIRTAQAAGLKTILFRETGDFERTLAEILR